MIFSFRIPQSTFRISIARPGHEIKNASWFLRRRSLPPGLAPGRRPPLGEAYISIRFEWVTFFKPSALLEVMPPNPHIIMQKKIEIG
jgi:hypothetical protein